jgi:GH3 auxin-responsive promoter
MIQILIFSIKIFLKPIYTSFLKELKNPKEAQEKVLKELLIRLNGTKYGNSYEVQNIKSYDVFKKNIPIVNFEQIEPWITQQKTGINAISNDTVLVYEKTSGSSGAAKYIPYTKGLKGSFEKMLFIWIYDLFVNVLDLKTGRIFMSISAAFHKEIKTSSGIKIGFEDDSEYLPRVLQILLKPFLNIPPKIKKVQDPFHYKRILSAYLVADRKLEIISIWNPTYLTSLLDFITKNKIVIADDLKRGKIEYENNTFFLPKVTSAQLELLIQETLDWSKIWPSLKLISCWVDGSAEYFVKELKTIFPHVPIQGKGLIATEAPMTIPLMDTQGGVPLLNEVFFEFEDADGEIHLLHELSLGHEYDLIISQKSGFMRYRIGDRVQVISLKENTPCLKFLGRTNQVSDLVGEKLNEIFVRETLSSYFRKEKSFWCLIPTIDNYMAYYTCLSDDPDCSTSTFIESLENALQDSFHYRNARLLNQLERLKVTYHPQAKDQYYSFFMSRGMKWGDIKYTALLNKTEIANNFLLYLNT